MFRQMMLMTVATVMMASTGFAANSEKVEKNERSEREKVESAKVETDISKGKSTANQERIFSMASKLVDSASKDKNCDALCQRTLSSLELVARQKGDLGLAGNMKPETAIIRITKEAKTMPISEAVKKVLADQNIKQDSLLKCAGK